LPKLISTHLAPSSTSVLILDPVYACGH